MDTFVRDPDEIRDALGDRAVPTQAPLAVNAPRERGETDPGEDDEPGTAPA
jgi:hypothetical protein